MELATDVDHCGACDTSCGAAGVSARACALGSCKPTCDATHTDCDGIGANGCEAALDDDAKNCGACGHACSVNGATSACKNRQCKATCLPGRADCNGNPDDGCEVDLKTDAASCGACGHVCAVTNASVTACSAGACKPACAANYGDCNSPASAAADDGCETNLTLATSCGGCGHNCQGGTCTRATCDSVTLASGLPVPGALAVDDRYVHFMTAPEHLVRYSLERVTTSGTNHELIGTYPLASLVADGTYLFLGVPNLADGEKGKVVRVTSGMEDFKEVVIGDVGSIAADGKSFYFSRATIPGGATDGHIYQMTRDLGTSGQVSSATGRFVDVASDGSTVFGLTASGLVAQPLSGGSPKQTALLPAPDPHGPWLAFDGSHLYTWVADSTASVSKLAQMPKTLQGTPTVLATSPSGGPVAADGNFVYYSDGSGLYRVRNTGGAPVKLVASAGIADIVVWKGAVYWTSGGLSADAGSVSKLAVFAD